MFGSVEDVLQANDLVQLGQRHVDGLLLLQLVAVGALGQVEAVGHPGGAENKIPRQRYCKWLDPERRIPCPE